MQAALFVLASTIALVVASKPASFLSEEYIQSINDQASTWKAGRNFPEDTSLDQIRGLLGALESKDRVLKSKEGNSIAVDSIPESFDSRENWPNCTIIRRIADQSACGSCWAVAAASAISDRICIHSNATKQVSISAADLIGCCGLQCGIGCSGGFTDRAWNYWVNTGIVTGGPYGSGEGCKEYPFPPCSHDPSAGTENPCSSHKYQAPSCVKKCDSNGISYPTDLHKGSQAYDVYGSVQKFQEDIMTNGPLEATFVVNTDFMSYKSGVYQKTPGSESLGLHAVRVLGWGTENGTPYWLIANSWNGNWGDRGFFKIIRGKNECSLEYSMVGGIPAL